MRSRTRGNGCRPRSVSRVHYIALLAIMLALLHPHTVLWVTAQPAEEHSTIETTTCVAGTDDTGTCRLPSGCERVVKVDSRSNSLYASGSSAQAFKPDAPLQSTVCDTNNIHKKYKVASWPYSRSSRQPPAPTLKVRVKLWSCLPQHQDEEGTASSSSCCHSLKMPKEEEDDTQVQVWQTRPDGTYSSLRPGHDEGDCRATLIRSKDNDLEYEFSTLAPGSTGSLGGLGPGGWEFPPYGPPTLQLLATSGHHQPLLVQVPLLIDPVTLELRPFSGFTHWQGHAAYRSTPAATTTQAHKNYEIASWNKVSESTIQLDLDLYLTTLPEDAIATEKESGLRDYMCPSLSNILPPFFFVEPLAVCSPLLLDFFPL